MLIRISLYSLLCAVALVAVNPPARAQPPDPAAQAEIKALRGVWKGQTDKKIEFRLYVKDDGFYGVSAFDPKNNLSQSFSTGVSKFVEEKGFKATDWTFSYQLKKDTIEIRSVAPQFAGECVLKRYITWATPDKEATYDGKSVSEWAKQLDANGEEKEQLLTLNVLKELETDAAPALKQISSLLKSKSAVVRGRAVRELARFGAKATFALPDVLVLAKDADSYIRAEVYQALAQLKAEPQVALPVLLEGQKEQHFRTRESALVGLAPYASADKRVLPAIVAMFKDSEQPLRFRSVEVIGTLGEQASEYAPQLVEVLRSERDKHVREVAIVALERVKADAKLAGPALAYAAVADRSQGIGSRAEQALKRLAPDDAAKYLQQAKDIFLKEAAVAETEAKALRGRWTNTIGEDNLAIEFDSERSTTRIHVKKKLKEGYNYIKDFSVSTIAVARDKQAYDEFSPQDVAKYTRDGDKLLLTIDVPRSKLKGTWELRRYLTPASDGQEATYQGRPVSEWLKRLEDPDAAKVKEVCNAISEIAAFDYTNPLDAAIAPAIKLLKANDKSVRSEVVLLLSFLQSRRSSQEKASAALSKVLPDLVAIAQNKDVPNRATGLQVAINAGLEPKEAVALLLAGAKEDTPKFRSDIVRLMSNAKLKGQADTLIPALIVSLKDAEGSVRESAIRALGEWGTPAQAAVPDLLAIMEREPVPKQPFGGLRVIVVGTLNRIHPDKDKLVAKYIEYLRSDNLEVVRTAIHGLQFMGDRNKAKVAVPALVELATHKDAEIARNARQVALSLDSNAARELLKE